MSASGVARFCANWAQLRIEAPSAATTAFVRLALQEPAADVPAQLLDCWQMENAAISSVGELRAVVAQLCAYRAVSCQEDGCQYAMRCICCNGGGG